LSRVEANTSSARPSLRPFARRYRIFTCPLPQVRCTGPWAMRPWFPRRRALFQSIPEAASYARRRLSLAGRAPSLLLGAAFAEKCPPGRPKNGHPAVAPTPVPTVHWRRGGRYCCRGGRYCLPTFLKYRARFLSLAAPTHPSGAAFLLRRACGSKTSSAASPSRYGGRPEAGHDSRDRRLPRCEKPRITVCVRLLPGSTIGSGKRRVLLILPLLEQPGFSLARGMGPMP
jgi:hypothetical protein